MPLNVRVGLVERAGREMQTTQAGHAEKLTDLDRRVYGLEQARLAWHERLALYAAAVGVLWELFFK